jgi:hypothetical protein
VEGIVVSELESDVFYATIILRIDDEEVEVDSRPSDALALAVRTQSPVYAEEAVLEQAGIWLDEETGKPIPAEGQGETNRKRRKVSQEDLQGMSAFADFISTLNLDDIDRDE